MVSEGQHVTGLRRITSSDLPTVRVVVGAGHVCHLSVVGAAAVGATVGIIFQLFVVPPVLNRALTRGRCPSCRRVIRFTAERTKAESGCGCGAEGA